MTSRTPMTAPAVDTPLTTDEREAFADGARFVIAHPAIHDGRTYQMARAIVRYDAALLAAHRERDQAEESRVTNAKLLDRALQDLAAARQEVEALRNALEEVEESLNHPDLAGANARCDAIALTVAAALAATPEEKNDAP